jgi:nucleoid DNA-binding protein
MVESRWRAKDLALTVGGVVATVPANFMGDSKNMTKRDIVIRISNDTGLIQQDVMTVVQKTLDYITEAMINGQTVELRNFGVFEVKLRKPRIGRNPNDPGKDVAIPARAVVKFKPGKEMREQVLALTAKIAANSTPPPPAAAQ